MSACHTFTELLPAVHDTLYSFGIEKEERDSLFTVENIFVVVLLADLKPFFKDGLLRAINKTCCVLSFNASPLMQLKSLRIFRLQERTN